MIVDNFFLLFQNICLILCLLGLKKIYEKFIARTCKTRVYFQLEKLVYLKIKFNLKIN